VSEAQRHHATVDQHGHPSQPLAALKRPGDYPGAPIVYLDTPSDDIGTHLKLAADEGASRAGIGQRQHYNFMLDRQGQITCDVTPYEKVTGHYVTAQRLAIMSTLKGKRPAQLVVTRESRDMLLSLARGDQGYTVQPELIDATHSAIAAYQAHRAPLYPLSDTQRIGFLDEHDHIRCRENWLGFIAGEDYHLSTRSSTVTRQMTIANAMGSNDDVTRTGQELVIQIHDTTYTTTHSFLTEHDGMTYTQFEIDHQTTHPAAALLQFFEVPQVPDISQTMPEKFQQNLTRLREIETGINARTQRSS
jgi:hypothetical protein